jgi:hypothetical protein
MNVVGWSTPSTPNTIGLVVQHPPNVAPAPLQINFNNTNEN